MDGKLFGERLRKLREEQAITQVTLAGRIGVDQAQISKWEHGRSWPTIKNLRRLAAVLNTTVDALLAREEPAA